jgi:hypothetical protein
VTPAGVAQIGFLQAEMGRSVKRIAQIGSNFIDRAKRPFISIFYSQFISAMADGDGNECLQFSAAADRTGLGPRF